MISSDYFGMAREKLQKIFFTPTVVRDIFRMPENGQKAATKLCTATCNITGFMGMLCHFDKILQIISANWCAVNGKMR